MFNFNLNSRNKEKANKKFSDVTKPKDDSLYEGQLSEDDLEKITTITDENEYRGMMREKKRLEEERDKQSRIGSL